MARYREPLGGGCHGRPMLLLRVLVVAVVVLVLVVAVVLVVPVAV